MELNDDQLKWCDRDQLKMPSEERREYREQADRLVAKLRAKLRESSEYRVKKIVAAGSLEKGTILQPTPARPPDADIVVYLSGSIADFDLLTMREDLIEFLMAAYPQMSRKQFAPQPRTLGVAFRQSGLEIDLVPVIAHPDLDDYGFQPVPGGDPGDAMLTSAPGQLAFAATRRKGDPLYRTLVRFVKRWRDVRQLDYLSSFAVELLVAHVQDEMGPMSSVFHGLHRFFNYIADTQLRVTILFTENGAVTKLPEGSAVLLDPVNADNNVLAKITETQRDELVAESNVAWTTLWDARTELDEARTVELWRTLLGRGFRLREEQAA